MADTTPTYGLPFQELGDAPDGPTLGEDLALAVEAELARIDAAIAAINGMSNVSIGSTTDELTFTNTTFQPGASPVGVAFTAPASGEVLIHYTFQIQSNINGQSAFGSCEVRSGAVVGSGTLAGTAANSDRSITTSKAVNASAPALIQASRTVRYLGLTPGAAYNVRLLHCVDGGSGSVTYREVVVQPQL